MRYWLSLLLMMLKIQCFSRSAVEKPVDGNHPSHRRHTARYQAKKSIVRSVWIAAASLMLINPALPVIMIIALPVTLLSFMILDETP